MKRRRARRRDCLPDTRSKNMNGAILNLKITRDSRVTKWYVDMHCKLEISTGRLGRARVGSARAGSGWVGSGWVGSGGLGAGPARAGSGWAGSGWVGSG